MLFTSLSLPFASTTSDFLSVNFSLTRARGLFMGTLSAEGTRDDSRGEKDPPSTSRGEQEQGALQGWELAAPGEVYEGQRA